MTIAYADPPYPGMAHFYECEEVDHTELVQFLCEQFPDGDTFADIFHGSGAVARAWQSYRTERLFSSVADKDEPSLFGGAA